MSRTEERAWIIGNAPSIANLDMHCLKDEVTFSFNRAYIAYEDWGWLPTYYMVIDMLMILQIANDVNQLVERGGINGFFINLDACNLVTPADTTYFLDLRDAWGFNPGRMNYCGDVAACALQVAYLLGYRDVVLVGVDLDWGKHGETSPGHDTDHFRLDYEIDSVRMSPPYADSHYTSWRMSIEQATAPPYNMRLTNASPTSRLCDLLPYTPFEELINARSRK